MPNWEFVVRNYGVGTGNSVANYRKVYTEYLVFLPNFVIRKIFKVGNTDWYYCFWFMDHVQEVWCESLFAR